MFTDAAIKRLQPRAAPYREFEGGEIPGFCLQITPTGTRTFYLQHTSQGRRRFFRLGQYPHLSLSAARAVARDYLATLATGGDPQAPVRSELGSVADLLDAWLVHQRELEGRRLDDVERAIRGNCAAVMDCAASDITASDHPCQLADHSLFLLIGYTASPYSLRSTSNSTQPQWPFFLHHSAL